MTDFAVIFDMDGVIVDTNVFHKKAIHQFREKYGFTLTEEQLRITIYGRTNKDWITRLFGTLTPDQLSAYAHEKEQLFRDLYLPHIKPVKGLLELLIKLKEQNIPTAIATSAPPENVEFVLENIPIREYFNTILDERVVTHGKPDPEIYIKTAAALGFRNERCIVIKDSLSGVTAGRKSGSKVIGITTTHSPDELTDANFVIHDSDELNISMLPEILEM
jgi:HAD superfamily hydrolase (TIGR01509 family)